MSDSCCLPASWLDDGGLLSVAAGGRCACGRTVRCRARWRTPLPAQPCSPPNAMILLHHAGRVLCWAGSVRCNESASPRGHVVVPMFERRARWYSLL